VPRTENTNPVVEDDQRDGYIFTTILADDPLSTTPSITPSVWVFKAWQLASGPICKLVHPLPAEAPVLYCRWYASVQESVEGLKIASRVEHATAAAYSL
jgi:hypothetical protein